MNKLEIQSIDKELEKLGGISDIIGTALVNRNGLLVASRLPRDVDDRKFCAMAATMFGAIETAASTIGSNKVDNITVEFSDFQLIIMETNENMILVSLLNLNINLGLFFIEIEEGVKNIKKILNR
ncbi:MAG: roadblock/LC7 domain-containing protein [Candidatus Lokiarchaeota archaeon]|nr:roadblock/LC7 domain-containing protein [Candidatus Lokiarchaeota archaeon]